MTFEQYQVMRNAMISGQVTCELRHEPISDIATYAPMLARREDEIVAALRETALEKVTMQ